LHKKLKWSRCGLGQAWGQIDDLAERIRQIEGRLAEQDKE